MTDPIDETHAASEQAIKQIRMYTAQIRERIGGWNPRPVPDAWTGVQPIVITPRQRRRRHGHG
jgi:hypothetical protein